MRSDMSLNMVQSGRLRRAVFPRRSATHTDIEHIAENCERCVFSATCRSYRRMSRVDKNPTLAAWARGRLGFSILRLRAPQRLRSAENGHSPAAKFVALKPRSIWGIPDFAFRLF